MIAKLKLATTGDDAMKTDALQPRISTVGLALCVVSIAAGVALGALVASRVPVFAAVALGLYLLFAIRVADQWEKVAALRFGRYRGLRGPGLFHIIPIVGRMSRYVDQRSG
jgi:regulator of protease activity HflC (stomatin/prohibitin superfamily)